MHAKTDSDLIEVEFTHDELNRAMQLCDINLSAMYLQNLRVILVRQLATQQFTDPNKDGEAHRERAYWKGQLDMLDTLIDGIHNPTPVPLNNPVSPQQEVFLNHHDSQES